MRVIWLDDGAVACSVEEEGFADAEVVASLETALTLLPYGREWLTLIREGYTAEEARCKLGLSRRWLARAREACRRALEVHR
jgi:DNA-directed RNA polymerase specialized sigma24 family protein